MDGTLAVIFFVASLTDMGFNDCPTGCLAQAAAPGRVSFNLSDLQFQNESIGGEVMLAYDLPRSFGPFQPTVGLSSTDSGDIWLGAGARWTSQELFAGPLFVEASFMPGFYFNDAGPDLGGNLHFRSSLGVGYAFANGTTVSVAYDHRSNGDTLSYNPGLETLALRVAVPLR